MKYGLSKEVLNNYRLQAFVSSLSKLVIRTKYLITKSSPGPRSKI